MYSLKLKSTMTAAKLLLALILCLYGCQMTLGSKILILYAVGTRSHMQFVGEIAKTLAFRGHQITLVSGYSMNDHPNITSVDLNLRMENYVKPFDNRNMATQISTWFHVRPALCVEALGRKEVQELRIEDYDLVFLGLVTQECLLSLLETKDVPFIVLLPNMLFSYINDLVGNINFPSFVNSLGSFSIHPHGFYQRLSNVMLDLTFDLMGKLFFLPRIMKRCRQAGFCKENMSFTDISKRTSMIFINSVRNLEVPARPYVPAVVHAGGLNCRPAKPLPDELEEWVQDSGDAGFIYFSLGSVVTPSDMPDRYRQVMVNVFASLPQRVLWKWNLNQTEDFSSNVKLAQWLPQQDILGHPKLKLFISHGGLFSTFESIYHGIPILGMPVYGDQTTNVKKVVSEGYGTMLEWDDLTENHLIEKINEIIHTNRYREAVKKRSALMRDLPMSPQDTVIYWTEYVIRYKGAPHLRSPVVDMPWYIIYNMDVWALLAALTIIVVVLLLLLLKWVVMLLIRRFFRGQGSDRQHLGRKKKRN